MNPAPRGAWFAVALASALAAQDRAADEALVKDAAADAGARASALARLQQQGQLDAHALAAALGSPCEEVRTTAARVLRHAWVEVPQSVHDALANSPDAAIALLRELALAPRPSLDAFAAASAKSADAETKLLAIAARTAPPSREEAAFVLDRLAGDAERTAALACPRLEPATADALVSRLHMLLEKELPVDRVGPFLERLSPNGVRQLLGLAVSLPDAQSAALVDRLAQANDAEFAERVRAMLDGKLPMQASWLRRCGPELGDPARRARVAALCTKGADPSASEADVALAVAAFGALIDGGVYEPAMADFARLGRGDRWRLLAQRRMAGMPRDLFAREFDFENARLPDSVNMLRALATARQAWTKALEDRVVAFAAREKLPPGGSESPTFREALRVLATAGGDSAAAAAVQLAGRDVSSLAWVVEHFAHRKDPVGAEAMRDLAEELPLTGDDAFADLHRTILLLLAETGNAVDVGPLVATAGTARPSFLHRCRSVWPKLGGEHVDVLLPLASAAEPETRAELLQWLAGTPTAPVLALLRAGLEDPEEVVREAAFEALLRTPERAELLAAGRAAFGADPGRDEDFAYAALATLGEPCAEADVQFVQWLLFTAPRRDPRERERAEHFADARAGFPMVAALAAHLRRAPALATAVCERARELAAKGDVDGLFRQRFLYLWTGLQADAELRAAVAEATAELVLAIPDAGEAGLGLASYYAARDAERRGDLEKAAQRATAAVARFLLDPTAGIDQRIHLGVREPFEGLDSHAALAAAPHRLRAALLLQRGDAAGARAELVLARELAGRDAPTLLALETLAKDLR